MSNLTPSQAISNDNKLFSTDGINSLTIRKQRNNLLTGLWKENENQLQFNIKRIQVFEMNETIERKQKRKNDEKARQDELEKTSLENYLNNTPEDIQNYLNDIQDHFSLVCK